MKIDLRKLEQIAVDESSAESKIAAERKENGDMYKASFRIAMKVKRALRMKNMTQARLSELMGVDSSLVSKYLTGKANMELKTIVKIEKALGINIIDREISPKKKKEVIILSNAYEKVETISQNIEEGRISKSHISVNEDPIRISGNIDFTSHSNSDFTSFPQKRRGRRSKKEVHICYLEIV